MVVAKEFTYWCPDIRTQMDEAAARALLFAAPGVDDVEIDLRTGMVRVVCVNQDLGADLREKLSNAGYPPTTEERDYFREAV